MLTLERLTVGEAHHLDVRPPFMVRPDEDFSHIVERFANMPELKGIFVLDESQRLLGVITRIDLLDWVSARLNPLSQELFSVELEKAMRLVNLMHASTAGEVMHPDSHQSAVKVNDTLAHALRLMVKLGLIVLPVIDDDNRLIGDLKLSEVLARVAREEEED